MDGAIGLEPEGSTLPADVFQLDDFVDRCMGNHDFAERILTKYGQRFPQDVTELRTSCDEGDPERTAAVAHRLKGSAASVSALRLESLFAEIERRSRRGELDQLPPLLEQIESEWNRFLPDAVALLQQARRDAESE